MSGRRGDDRSPSEIHVKHPETWASGIPAVAVSVSRTVEQAGPCNASKAMRVINQTNGFDCPGCAWPEPKRRHLVEFCEQGAKAVADSADSVSCGAHFFLSHTLAQLASHDDYWLGRQGRITTPVIKRPGDDRYHPIGWDEALAEIADGLAECDDPDQAIFYTSGRTSNEAAFALQLLARAFGTNNLPDCSNLCHEPTSVALAEAIGAGKGTVTFEDFETTDLVIVVGQNPGSNHPRMLGTLEAVKQRGGRIIAVNPLPEAGLLRFKNPQRASGIIGQGTELADLHLPIRLGGDQALFRWLCQQVISTDTVDHAFVDEHTNGLAAFVDAIAEPFDVNRETGLTSQALAQAWDLIRSAERIIVCWAMGITQHRDAVATIREITNFALLTGNLGRSGAGLCPVRGHSNVQGDRTMGIWHAPPKALLDRLRDRFDFQPPTQHGFDAVDSLAAMRDGRARVLFSMGGNLARALPDTNVVEQALQRCRLTVHVSTKLNRSHMWAGETSIILPTLTRTDVDRRPGGEQFVTVEDSFGTVHASRGNLAAPVESLRSEVAIVASLGERLVPHLAERWAAYLHDYAAVRADIAAVIDGFERFEQRVAAPGGFLLAHPVRDELRFTTDSGRAEFAAQPLHAGYRASEGGADDGSVVPTLILQSLRSHDQYNTTIYGHDDRYRGISGNRRVVMVNPTDLERLGLADGAIVDIHAGSNGSARTAEGFRVVAYPTPPGNAAAYYPEANVLTAIDDRSAESGTPSYKSIPVRLTPCA